ncbi:hypothetical protein [Arthrospiribacter ruber]|uniref:Uncharacterized protein n=1 Tax=Arthrospiribacter ruber TaxID=2487934 RepID=A0A951IXF4_9BACT|nr:hypothetical protein [Arthrospiribacter ruber]MBW3468960.1 hypothetical protein [Arthrospiribacter ruber]
MDTLQQAYISLTRDFELPPYSQQSKKEELVQLLTPVLKHLLDRDFERLLQICYKIDLGEAKLKSILYESLPEQMATDLAQALVDRQVQKIEIRKRYS